MNPETKFEMFYRSLLGVALIAVSVLLVIWAVWHICGCAIRWVSQ